MGLPAYRCSHFALLLPLGLAAVSMPLHAQTAPEMSESKSSDDLFPEGETLDPDQPLAEFPDFGVDWPGLADLPDEDEVEEVDEVNENLGDLEAAEAKVEKLEQNEEALVQAFQPDEILAEQGYKVRFSGLPDGVSKSFSNRFDNLSALEQFRRNGANFAQIKRRTETDRELVEQLLQIEGYYDADVRTRFEAAKSSSSSGDLSIIFAVVAGPQYRLSEITLAGIEKAAGSDPSRFREIFAVQPGDVINSDQIIDSQFLLDQAMLENGYPFARSEEPELVIDHAERDGDLNIPIMPGGRYNFGSITMAQTQLFGPEHVQQIARFNKGDLYKASDVEDLRRALIATGLISTISLDPVVSQEPGMVDLAVSLTPAPLRTIAGEVGFGTGEGLRTEVSWEHRNLFPPEGLIRLAAVVATQEQAGSFIFRRNNFRRRDNVLNGRVSLSNIDRDAFEARTLTVSANIERQSNLIYQKRWSWSAGVELLASDERDVVGATGTTRRQTFFIGALPATLTYDASDDLLDPTSGFRLGVRLSPEASLQSGSFFYARAQIDGSAYFPVSEKLVLAGRTRIGTIAGARNNRIAPSRRLYSGGGGSVRGFGYQRIGPRDVNNDPVGGRSLVEFSIEARFRLGNFGIVPFIDAGNVYTDPVPKFTGFRFGAGVGVRYYSDFGPIRIDIGTPVNPARGDNPVTVNISLGQAF